MSTGWDTPYTGEIRAFGFNFPPRGWAQCNGQLLPIQGNVGLFSLLGTTYGGDGQTTFALPDLRGRMPIHQGQGPGLSLRDLGSANGREAVTLLESEIPVHSHRAIAGATLSTKNPDGSVPAPGSSYGATPDTAMDAAMVKVAGGDQPHLNMPPYLTLNWCIALQGVFPPR